METYQARDKLLTYLGFADYRDYLRSELWAIVRRVVFERDRFRCQVPGCKHRSSPIEAHHVSYALPVLLGANPGSIVTMCSIHHEKVEFEKGEKLQLHKAQAKTISLLPIKGKKYRNVANWLLQRRKTQKHVARRTALLLRPTVYYTKVVGELRRGKIHKSYYEYLGIKKGRK